MARAAPRISPLAKRALPRRALPRSTPLPDTVTVVAAAAGAAITKVGAGAVITEPKRQKRVKQRISLDSI